MEFVPRGFEPPTLQTGRFHLRPITIHDVVKDYDAVMSSRDHLWKMFGEQWGWPQSDLMLEQDLIDLGWHHKEFQLNSSFDYAVVSPDESRMLGCVYVFPPPKVGFDAEVTLWVRADALELDEPLYQAVRLWLHDAWPFTSVAYPGRAHPWAEYNTLPDVQPG